MRKLAVLSALFFMLVLAGCDKKSQPELKTSGEESAEYKKTDTIDYTIEDEGIKEVFLMPDMCLAYVAESIEEGVIIKKYTDSSERPDKTLETAGAFFVAVSKNTDKALTIITASDDDYYLDYYDSEERRKTISVPRTLTGEEYPVFSCKTANGYFMLLTHSAAFLIDDSGKIVKEKEYAEDSINRAIQLSDGTICVTSVKSENDRSITCVDGNSLELSSKVIIDIYPYLIFENAGKCFFSDWQDIYSFSFSELRAQRFCSLQNFYLRRECIRDISFSDGKMFIAYYDKETSYNTAKVLKYEKKDAELTGYNNQNGDYDDNGKRIIYLYSSSGVNYVRAGFGDAIREFNIDNPDYAVRIMEGEGNIDIAVDKSFNPDIICEVQPTIIARYARVGYLEDLWPFIDESSTFERSDFADVVRKLYETEGHLYGITNEIHIKGICLTDVGTNFDGSWTVEEFIEWLVKHKNVITRSGITVPSVAGFCLWGLINDNVDFESGQANFVNERFIKIIDNIKGLSFDNTNADQYLSDLQLIDEAKTKPILNSGTVGSIGFMAQMDAILGKRYEYIGYPSDSDVAQGVLSPLFNVAITTDSECKEGAYAFIEYWLERGERILSIDKQDHSEETNSNGTFSVIKRIFDENIKSGLGKRKLLPDSGTGVEKAFEYNVTEDYIADAKKMIDTAEPETYEIYQVKLIVAEELQNFLEGKSDAETTAKVIQSRVQLFLDEIK